MGSPVSSSTPRVSFVIKSTLGLTEPSSIKIGAPRRSESFNYFFSRELKEMVKIIVESSKKVDLTEATPREALQVFLRRPIEELNAQPLIHWGFDGHGLVLPKTTKYTMSALKISRDFSELIAFAYSKKGDLPVMVFGYVRRIDLERGLVSVSLDSSLSPKNYLIEEIIGTYESETTCGSSWFFDFEPLTRGRTKVSVSFQEGFRRKTVNRGGKPSTTGKPPKPLKRKSLEALTEQDSVSDGLTVGEIFEFTNSSGQRIGLRVAYVKNERNS